MNIEKTVQPLVSICIPTYNRSECLIQTLNSIIDQPEFKDGRVDVVINDNASTDDTEKVCFTYAAKYKGIHYFRNAKNIRDKNFPTVLSRATGKLRKLNNDTAVMEPGSLAYLCEMEQKYEYGKPLLFFSNGNREKGIGKDDGIFRFNEFVEKISYWITWIASFSLWEEDCTNIATDYDGCELRLWQVKKIYEIGSKKDAVAVCPKKIISSIAPPKKDISYGLYTVFYENYFKIVDPYVENGLVTQEVRNWLERNLFVEFFPDWIIQWETNNINLKYSEDENLKKIVFEHCKTKPFWDGFYKTYKKKRIKHAIICRVKKIKSLAGKSRDVRKLARIW